ncbi:MAG: pyroglutamyl-peptidase I [Pseudomonadota bacterium]|jgi:pyroglutamyl-peptidase
MEHLRILVTGFGPFPGAPYNPTERLVARLGQLRRPALADVTVNRHIFHVSYGAVDRELPTLIARNKPHALLMFGLAQRTPHVRIETRARNAVTTLWPDADHGRGEAAGIARHAAPDRHFGPHTQLLLRAALQAGVWARPSRDAGRYLCNYLSWKAIEATDTPGGPRLAAFVHVPLVPRDTAGPRRSAARRVTFEELVNAGEAMLVMLAALTRQCLREAAGD